MIIQIHSQKDLVVEEPPLVRIGGKKPIDTMGGSCAILFSFVDPVFVSSKM